MQNQDKTRDQLIEELNETRRELAEAQAGQHSSREGEQHALESESRLRLALDAARVVVWDWDLKAGRAIREENYTHILGYEPNELDSGVRTWKRLIHPDDWGKVSESLNEHLSGLLPFFGPNIGFGTSPANGFGFNPEARWWNMTKKANPLECGGLQSM